MMQFRNNICFIIEISWIFVHSYICYYLCYINYAQFIHILSKNLAKKKYIICKIISGNCVK